MSARVVSDTHYSVQQATAESKRLIYMIQDGDGPGRGITLTLSTVSSNNKLFFS
jgi:mannitol-specific phosphotransferase system IIBC component